MKSRLVESILENVNEKSKEERIEELKSQIDYEERKLDVTGYGKSDLAYLDSLKAELAELEGEQINESSKLNEDKEEDEFDSRLKTCRDTQQTFAENLDLEPLYNKLREMVGDNSIQFEKEIKNGSYGPYVEFNSNNIVDKCGIFQLAIKELYICSFSTGIVIDNMDEFLHDKEGKVQLKEPRYWTMVDFYYQSHGGGRNGMEILSAFYNEDESHEWVFNERRK